MSGGRRSGLARRAATWILVAPAAAGLVAFVAAPFALAAVLSLTDMRMGSPVAPNVVGVENYARLFGDPSFLRALVNNALFAAVVVPLQTALALALAVLLDRPLRARAAFRTLFFLPVVFPLSLISVTWILIYAPGPNGLMNATLEALTFGAWTPQNFLRDPYLALPAIMLTSIWQGTGFQMVILLAGLQSIPNSLYEAAKIDGAGAWRRFRSVTLPMLRNPLIFVITVTTIFSFRLFDQVQIMTQGGPRGATTTVMFEAVRAAFDRQQVGRGAAASLVMFVAVLAVTVLLRRFARHEGTRS
jgi:multiple sugar transport system permease protein